MKTLDEVIKNFEICRKARLNLISCDGCTYAIGDNDFCIDCNEIDVLEWLKGYRAHIELDKIRDKCETENEPLTWSELELMEGKPVWIEVDNHLPGRKRTKYKDWEVIDMIAEDLILVKGDYSYQKDEFGDVWQVYRKERE